jgi:hypothetical protein
MAKTRLKLQTITVADCHFRSLNYLKMKLESIFWIILISFHQFQEQPGLSFISYVNILHEGHELSCAPFTSSTSMIAIFHDPTTTTTTK